MKTILNKFISLLLIIVLFLSSSLVGFGYHYDSEIESNNIIEVGAKDIINSKEELSKKYHIKSEIDTPYGKVYLLIDKNKLSIKNQLLAGNQFQAQPKAIGFWDILDIGMAVSSWAKLFGEPNWENAGWAVLDTISLVPLIPSLKHVRNSNEALQKIKEFASKSKENFKKVLDKFKIGKYHIENVFKYRLFPKIIRFPSIKITISQLKKKFYHAKHLGLTHYDHISKVNSNEELLSILKKYQNEIVRILSTSKEIYESKVGNTLVYTFLSGNKLVHIRKDNFEFLSAYPLTSEKYKRLKFTNVLVKKVGELRIIKHFFK